MIQGKVTIHQEHSFTISIICVDYYQDYDGLYVLYKVCLECESTNIKGLEYRLWCEADNIPIEVIHPSPDLGRWEFCRGNEYAGILRYPVLEGSLDSTVEPVLSKNLSLVEGLIVQEAISLAVANKEATKQAYISFFTNEVKKKEDLIQSANTEIARINGLIKELESDRI
jgi:hypothetical protein